MILQDAAVDQQERPAQRHGSKTEYLMELCDGMHGFSGICHDVLMRFIDVDKQLTNMSKIARRGPKRDYLQILKRLDVFLKKYSRKPMVTHIVSSQRILETCERAHQELDHFMLEYDDNLFRSAIHLNWEKQFSNNAKVYKLQIEELIQMDQTTLFDELQDPDAQQEVLVLLLFECDTREFKYSESEMDLMHRIFQHISSFSKLGIPSIPDWFVPPQDVDVDGEFASGSFGSVHRGRWNGAEVVVKSAFLLDAQSRNMFMNEVEIWYKLQHPNIVQLYKACHVGNPFFVCEYAENGTLVDFLYRKNDRPNMWQKLFEAARGLRYLHEEHKVVHGDLKCNNILVGGTHSSGDGSAKLTDFGLSFKVSSESVDPIAEDVGAIQWKAPEVIEGRTRGSLAADVYSFGMCILEAVKGGLPWGNYSDATVKHKLLSCKELPNRPDAVNDAQWALVSRMCAWEPSDRPVMKEVVETLQDLVESYSIEA